MRAAAQLVLPGPTSSIPEVADRVLAFQAQDFSAGCWSVGLRAEPGTGRSDVLAGLADGRLVRSWPLRGTLQIVSRHAVRPMLAVSGARSLRAMAGRRRQLGLDEAALARGEELARDLLSSGPMIRPNLMAAFEERGLNTAGQRGAHLLLALALTQVLCFGPLDGRQHTFVLLDDWVAPPDLQQDPLPWLAARYAESHGPVRVADLAWWAGITKTEAARGFAEAADALVELPADGGSAFVGRDSPALDAEMVAAAGDAVAVLPAFDELLLGYADRSAALPRERQDLVAPGANGLFRPVLSVGGRIIGTWQAKRDRSGTTVVPELFADETLPDGFGAAAARFAEFDLS